MPLLIVLKEPPVNLIVEGEIKDKDEAFWDGLFSNGVYIATNMTGENLVIPLWKESNVSFIQEVTKEQIEEQKKASEEASKEASKGNRITSPGYGFPGRRHSPGGGGITL